MQTTILHTSNPKQHKQIASVACWKKGFSLANSKLPRCQEGRIAWVIITSNKLVRAKGVFACANKFKPVKALRATT